MRLVTFIIMTLLVMTLLSALIIHMSRFVSELVAYTISMILFWIYLASIVVLSHRNRLMIEN